MTSGKPLALPLVLLLLAFSGCFGGAEVPDARRFSAAGGSVSPGWAYDGVGLDAGAATLDGMASDGANAGLINVTFEFGGERWVATFDTFAQAEGKEFMDGGVEFELGEHGDTGVADASVPKIHAVVAAWGRATVLRAGAPAADAPWSAHLMLAADTVRGTDGKIAKADGASPYDPAAPADARRIEGDPQAIFWIKHPQGETFARAPVTGSGSAACAGPGCAESVDVPAERGASGAVINYTVTPTGPAPLAVGRVALRVVNASGEEVIAAPQANILPNAQVIGNFVLTKDQIDGPLTIEITGDGAFSVTIDHVIAFADVPFLVVTWDEYTVESA